MGVEIAHREALQPVKKLRTHAHQRALGGLQHQPLLQPLSNHGNSINDGQQTEPARQSGNPRSEIGGVRVIVNKAVDNRTQQIGGRQRGNRIKQGTENCRPDQHLFSGDIAEQPSHGRLRVLRAAGCGHGAVAAGVSSHIHLPFSSACTFAAARQSAVFRFQARVSFFLPDSRFIHGLPPSANNKFPDKPYSFGSALRGFRRLRDAPRP